MLSNIRRSLLLIIFAIVISFNSSAQPSQKRNDSVFTLVQKYINDKNADALYALTGEGFRGRVAKEAFTHVSQQNLFAAGAIKEASLIKFTAGLSSYKVVFEFATFEIGLSLDNKNQMERFFFKPFATEKESAVPSTNKLQTLLDKQLDTIARKYIQKASTVGLCIGIIKDGKMSTYSYGETVRDNKTLPDENTLFEIGSITKTFTATLLAYYVNEHKVSLSDPITKYLPDSVAANKELKDITLVMLSNHTSGLAGLPDNFWPNASDPLNPYKDYNRSLMFSYLKSCKPDTTAGAQYNYSNLGVSLLANILEHVSGKSFEQMVEEVICKPLHMSSTVQHMNDALKKRFVSVYSDKGIPTTAWDLDAFAGAGALHSSVHDLLLYAAANLKTGKDPLSKAIALTHQITNTKTHDVGLGWHQITQKGDNVIWHNGGTYGSSSYLAFIPAKNVAVVVLSNSAVSTDAVGLGILGLLQ